MSRPRKTVPRSTLAELITLGLTRTQILSTLGISTQVLKRLLKEYDLPDPQRPTYRRKAVSEFRSKVCQYGQCGKDYTPKTGTQKYCSPDCAARANAGKPRGRWSSKKTRQCRACGAEFVIQSAKHHHCGECGLYQCADCERILPASSFHVRTKNGRPYSRCKDCQKAKYREVTKRERECPACGDLFYPLYARRHCGRCGKKQCSHCLQVKPESDFSARGLTCSACRSMGQRRYLLKRNYGITPERYDLMLASQGGQCPICLRSLDDGTPHVDHDHSCCPGTETCGKCIRGITHSSCNQMLGMAFDDPEILRRAANYLEAA